MANKPRDIQRGSAVDIDAEIGAGDGTGSDFGFEQENKPNSEKTPGNVRRSSSYGGFGNKIGPAFKKAPQDA